MDGGAWRAAVHRVTKRQTRWKQLSMHAHTDAIKHIFDSLEKVKISTLTEVWKKLITTFMDDFEGSKTSAEEVSTHVVESIRELEVEPEDVTERLQPHNETSTIEELLRMDNQRK